MNTKAPVPIDTLIVLVLGLVNVVVGVLLHSQFNLIMGIIVIVFVAFLRKV